MRRLFVCLCLALSGASVHAGQAGGADEAAVRAVVERYVAARTAEDASAIEALFTPDADQHTTSGEWRRGAADIVAGTARSSAQNPGRRSIRVESVRFLTPDVALADGPYEIASAGSSPARRMWTSIVLVRQAPGWRIAAIRNAVPTSATRP